MEIDEQQTILPNKVQSNSTNIKVIKEKICKMYINIKNIDKQVNSNTGEILTNTINSDKINTNTLNSSSISTNNINTEHIDIKTGTIQDISDDAPLNSIVNKNYVDTKYEEQGYFDPASQIDLTNSNVSLTSEGDIHIGVINKVNPKTILSKDGYISTNSLMINYGTKGDYANNEIINKQEMIDYVAEHSGSFDPSSLIELTHNNTSLTTTGNVNIGVSNVNPNGNVNIDKNGSIVIKSNNENSIISSGNVLIGPDDSNTKAHITLNKNGNIDIYDELTDNPTISITNEGNLTLNSITTNTVYFNEGKITDIDGLGSVIYTSNKVDSLLNSKMDADNAYTKDETYDKETVNEKLSLKMNSADAYDKNTIDSKLSLKMNSADAYTKNETYSNIEIDNKLNSYVPINNLILLNQEDNKKVYTADKTDDIFVKKTDLSNNITTDNLDSSISQLNKYALISVLESDYATKEELKGYNNVYYSNTLSKESNPSYSSIYLLRYYDNVYTLLKYDTSESQYNEYNDAPIGSLCIIGDNSKVIYVKYPNENSHQVWKVRNNYNYYVNNVIQDTVPTIKDTDFIFVYNTLDNVYTLMKWNGTLYETYNDIAVGSLCIVNSTKAVFINYLNENNHQVWINQTGIDTSQTLTLTNSSSLVTQGSIKVQDNSTDKITLNSSGNISASGEISASSFKINNETNAFAVKDTNQDGKTKLQEISSLSINNKEITDIQQGTSNNDKLTSKGYVDEQVNANKFDPTQTITLSGSDTSDNSLIVNNNAQFNKDISSKLLTSEKIKIVGNPSYYIKQMKESSYALYNLYCYNDYVYFSNPNSNEIFKYSLINYDYKLVCSNYINVKILTVENENVYNILSNKKLLIVKYNSETDTYTNVTKDFNYSYEINIMKCKNEIIYASAYDGSSNYYIYVYDTNNTEDTFTTLTLTDETINFSIDDNYLYILTKINDTYTIKKYILSDLSVLPIDYYTSNNSLTLCDNYIIESDNTSNTIITAYNVSTLQQEKQVSYESQLNIYRVYCYDNNIILIHKNNNIYYITMNETEEILSDEFININNYDYTLYKVNNQKQVLNNYKYILLQDNYNDELPDVRGYYLIIGNINVNMNITNDNFNIIYNDENVNNDTMAALQLNNNGITIKGKLIVENSAELQSGTISNTPENNNDIVNKSYVDNNNVGKKEYYDNSLTNDNELKGEIFNIYTGENKNTASGVYSHAEGYGTTASNDFSHAEGFKTIASGYSSHAEGDSTTASGTYSHSEGDKTIASGYNSHAEGAATIASDQYSHAEGYQTIALGYSSHAEGESTTALGSDSHAEGEETKASGNCSHAEGYKTEALANYSHASGYYTIANKEFMSAIGKYNINSSSLNEGILFVVGNGTDINTRSDAFVVEDDGSVFVQTSLTVNGHPVSSNSSKTLKSNEETIISACNNNVYIYTLNILNDKYVIYKYTNIKQQGLFTEINKEDYPNLKQVCIFDKYLLLLSDNVIYYIEIPEEPEEPEDIRNIKNEKLKEEITINKLLETSNINKIVIHPLNNQFYVLYNSYDYFSVYKLNGDNELIKDDYHMFTQENNYINEDLNVIDMKFYNNYVYFIHNSYEINSKRYIIFSNYDETNNSIIKVQSSITFNNEYCYIDSLAYEKYIYFLIQNETNTEIIRINVNTNNYKVYEDIINDSIIKRNNNLYNKYNESHFYLVSNNYIYYFNIERDSILLENKFYAENCKYITSNQNIYITNDGLYNVNNDVIINGDILLNGQIKTSTLNTIQLNISDIDVNVNKTIIHNTLIDGEIENYKVGMPVFIKDNKTYTLQRKSNDGKYPVYEYIEINSNNYTKNPINQIPKITYEDNGKFIGVIIGIYPKNTPLKINDITSNYIKINNDTIDFATHGDYIFKVINNIEHQTTKKINETDYEIRLYQVGDKLLYDGTIIDPDTPITSRLLSNCIGTITYIPEDNTDYVSVFKS